MALQRTAPANQPTRGQTQQLRRAADDARTNTDIGRSVQACPARPHPAWSCVRYGQQRGPAYSYGDPCQIRDINSYRGWNQQITSGQMSEGDARSILLMSPNEGGFNSVQAYDDQTITVGAMQKTIRPDGKGELMDQMVAFRERNPDQYRMLFQDQGWDVADVETTRTVGRGRQQRTVTTTQRQTQYTYTNDKGEQVTLRSRELHNFIRSYCDPAATPAQKAQAEQALDAMRRAGEDPAFQDQQIIDFKHRLDSAVGQTPRGYDHPISDYMTSDRGRALVLDQSVNRPGYVATDYGAALDRFYQQNPRVSRNPAEWGDNRERYETQINTLYGPTRRGTDMPTRYQNIMNAPAPVIPPDLPAAAQPPQ